MNEEDTNSSSRIFIKILFQELAEYMGLGKLNQRLKDPTLQGHFAGLFPRDSPKNTRFSINFFTSIGLGGLTDELREHLKNLPKNMPAANKEDSSGSSSDSSSSSSSESESSESSEDENRKRKTNYKRNSSQEGDRERSRRRRVERKPSEERQERRRKDYEWVKSRYEDNINALKDRKRAFERSREDRTRVKEEKRSRIKDEDRTRERRSERNRDRQRS